MTFSLYTRLTNSEIFDNFSEYKRDIMRCKSEQLIGGEST